MIKLHTLQFYRLYPRTVRMICGAGASLLAGCVLLLATPTVGILFNNLSTAQVVTNCLRENARAKHWRAHFEVEGATDFVQQDVSVAPGGSSGWHSHPGPVLITVKSGTATWYNSDDPECKARIYPAGSAFVEPANTPHYVGNDGQADLELLNTYIIPHGAAPRQDQPQPNHCAF
jgi:quercetin dioxygenase-like cupin family protein